MTRGSENKLYGKTYQIYTVAEKIISPPISKFKFKILILSLEILKSYYKCKFNAEFSRDIDIIWHKPTDCCLRVASIFKEIIFSCESSSRNANVCQSVSLSISLSVIQSFSLSVTLIFLFDLLVYFIIANRIK